VPRPSRNEGDEVSEKDEPFIKLPTPTGRVHDDSLSAIERALAEALVELPADRLRVLFHEVLTSKALQVEAEELLLDDDGL
jgi:hypothetical protein